MAILKIRDANGNVQEILAIKGNDGKDYVLTDADKQEIAGMVSGGGNVDLSDYALKSDVEANTETLENHEERIGAFEDKSFVEQIEYNSTDGALQGRAYVVDKYNVQTSKELRVTSATDSIPVRNHRGNFYVGQPNIDWECANKKYVDDELAKRYDNSEINSLISEGIYNKTIFGKGIFVGDVSGYQRMLFEEMKKITSVVSPEGTDVDSVITEDDYGWMALSGANENTYEIAFVGETYINVEMENITEGTYIRVNGVDLEIKYNCASFVGYVEENIVIHVSSGTVFVMLSPADFDAQIDKTGKGVFSEDIVLKKDGTRYSLLNLIERVDTLERNMPTSGDEESY